MSTIAQRLLNLYNNIVIANSVTNEFTQALPDCYEAVEEKGGTIPAEQTAANLPDAIESIPTGGGREYIPAEYQKLQYVSLVNNAAMYDGFIINVLSTGKIELTMSGEPGYNTRAVLLSGSNTNSAWIGWVGNETLQSSSGITFSQGTPSYTYSQLFDGNIHTITLIISQYSQLGLARVFGFPDATYNRPRKFYDIKIYAHNAVDGEATSHLVPAKRIADGAVGFYDSVMQVFYDYSTYLSE